MRETILKFERLSHLVAISALDTTDLCLPSIDSEGTIFCVSFTDYVKSQLHLNFISTLFDRDLGIYKRALDFLNGDTQYLGDAKCALRYFYTDISRFLINNKNNVVTRISVDADLIDTAEQRYDLEDVKSELLGFLAKVDMIPFTDLVHEVSDFKYATIFDDALSVEDIIDKIDSYCLAVVLKIQAAAPELEKICLEGF